MLRHLKRFWALRVLTGVLLALVALAAVGSGYQAVATERDRRTYPPPGELIDIGAPGNPLLVHVFCLGDGSPTVILESGQGGLSSDWAWVLPEVAQTTRVCAYDRAGVGWSHPGPAPRDAVQLGRELHALLDRANIAGPYILVGHSYGGLYVRTYTAAYPKDVAGMVLVDASHPDQWERLAEGEAQYARMQQTYMGWLVLTRLGVLRLLNFTPVHPSLPARAGREHKAMTDMLQFVQTAADEFAATTATNTQVRAAGDLGRLPLVVLSATEHGAPIGMEELEAELQRELAALSVNSVHHIVQGADHSSLVIDQGYAMTTSEAVRRVVVAARAGEPLSGSMAQTRSPKD
jgi:pimeloyl-ACP methyl ester carboxylesterase